MPATFVEIGYSGLRQWNGYVREEFLRDLQGTRAAKVWREMGDNDDVAGACLMAIEKIAGQVDWKVVGAEEDTQGPDKGAGTRGASSRRDTTQPRKRVRKADDKPQELDERGEFLRSCLFDDMDRPFRETIADALSMLQYGFAPLEICYKRRLPRNGDPADPRGSRFDDGRIGWAKWAIRQQYSVQRWAFDDDGAWSGLYQTTETDPEIFIPQEKVLLFRASPRGGNPESKSIFRNAFVNYYMKKRIREVEGIGIERNLAGLPVLTAPENEDWWNPNDTLGAAKLAHAQRVVSQIRADEQGGIVLPFGTTLTLLAGQGGGKSVDTDKVITRYDTRIAMTMLADFIMLGHEAVGSKALAVTKVDAFLLAMTAFLDHIEDLINRVAIPRLWKLNGWPIDASIPRLKHGKVGKADLAPLGEFLKNYAAAGGSLFPNTALEAHVHDVAELPPPPDGFEARQLEVEEAEAEAAAAEADRMAQELDIQREALAARGAKPATKKRGPKTAKE